MLPSVLEAILLGVVQGLSEFIPISSSGHLVLAEELLSLRPRPLAFEVALHIGTAAAVVVFFRAELVLMARGFLGRDRTPDGLLYRRLGVHTLLASVPVGVAGLTLEDFFERVFAAPAVAAGFLFVTAGLLFTGEHLRDRRVSRATGLARVSAHPPEQHSLPVGRDPSDPAGADLHQLTLPQAFGVGVSQCLALLPGVSRSGTTIVAGMAMGLTRPAATRFSFLLSLPALAGAAVLSLPELTAGGGEFTLTEVAAGVVAAFVSGYLAIRFLIALVSRDRLTGFAWYCLAVGAVATLLLRT